MKTTVQHPKYGTILYEENAWTGAKSLSVNGIQLQPQGKTAFVLANEFEAVTFTLKGSFVSGTQLVVGEECIQVTPKAKWYEIFCSVSIFCFVLVWSNSVALCSIFLIIGGALGGGISGLMSFLNVMVMKSQQTLGRKLLSWICMFAATVLVCWLLAMLFISAFAE